MALSKGRIVGLILIGVVVVVLGIVLLTGQQEDNKPIDARAFIRNTEKQLGKIERKAVDVRDHFGAEVEEELAQVDQLLATTREVLQRMQNVSDQVELRKLREEANAAYRAAQDILKEFE
ncbi:MAG TPA: hypothetical protein ENN51_00300 [candidate division WOR-3 bacterium]|uniref:Uncharacterized protein n=1 Tax=candidate division WOR-3 bacterium TaxID=2052148 RepID=A0A7V0T3T9_UNCW3|nr:hypothetical protein [candidate division WOR-3 bacterium]